MCCNAERRWRFVSFESSGCYLQGKRIINPLDIVSYFSQIISFFVSRRSHKSHRWRFASPALVGLAECFQPDGKRECNDAFFVRLPFPYGRRTRFVRSAWKSNICESVVYWNINYKDSVCYSFIMRSPCLYELGKRIITKRKEQTGTTGWQQLPHHARQWKSYAVSAIRPLFINMVIRIGGRWQVEWGRSLFCRGGFIKPPQVSVGIWNPLHIYGAQTLILVNGG